MDQSQRPRLQRSEVPEYLLQKHGIPVSPKTLNKWASTGGGPLITYCGRKPLYDLANLDIWAEQRLQKPVRSTSERISSSIADEAA